MTGQMVGVLVGWCSDETALEETRRGTHDALIAMMGDRRTGPVAWHQVTGVEASLALVQLDGSGAVVDPHVRRLFYRWGGWLVIASADGIAP